jgi:TonB family protein
MIAFFLFANLYAIVFYCLYRWLLQGKGSHAWSRVYLLVASTICLVLPLLRPDLHFLLPNGRPVSVMPMVQLDEIMVNKNTGSQWTSMVIWIYCSIAAALFIYQVVQLLKVIVLLGKTGSKEVDGYKVYLNTNIGPASIGRHIIFPGNEINPEIWKHETAHARGLHYIDTLYLRLLQCFFFPVVLLYYFRKELNMVHEFEADRVAATEDMDLYTSLLLGHQFGLQKSNSLLLTFFQHPLKRRLIMLHQPTPAPVKSRKLLIAGSAAVIFIGMIVQSGPELLAQTDTVSPAQEIMTVYKKPSEPASADPNLQKYDTDTVYTATDRVTVFKKPAEAVSSAASPSTQQTDTVISSSGLAMVYSRMDDTEQSVSGQPAEQDKDQSTEPGKTTVAKTAEQMPEFPGGVNGLREFLSRNIKYPKSARQQGISGKVIASFVVARDGTLKDLKILRGLCPDCDAEVLRILRQSPKWKPGRDAGKPVPVEYVLPVTFTLSN